MSGWKRDKVPSLLAQYSPGVRAWRKQVPDGVLTVFAGQEPSGFHLSISHTVDGQPGRLPSWDELRDARYRFAPLDVTMAMLLPPQAEYVNVHDTTFHLWENRDIDRA